MRGCTIDVPPPRAPRPIPLRSFVLFFLLAGSLLTVVPIAADIALLTFGLFQFLALLLAAAIVLTYYEVGIARRRPGSP